MATFLEMPQASPTMETGTLVAWLREEGDRLEPGDEVAEVETDKAAMPIEVFEPGWLLRKLVAPGEAVPAGAPIAILGTAPDEDVSGLLAEWEARRAAAGAGAAPRDAADAGTGEADAGEGAADAGTGEATAAVPDTPPSTGDAAPGAPTPSGAPAAGFARPTWMGRPLPAGILEPPTPVAEAPGRRPRTSPLARRLARERGVDLAAIRGTGPRGRIVREDIERAARAARATPGAPDRGDTLLPLTPMRRAIAGRLTEAWNQAPAFYLEALLEADRFRAFARALEQGGLKVSLNVLLLRCVALALREVPACNASFTPEGIVRHGGVHLGLAVALEEGLVTPVIRDADRLGLEALAERTRDLVERARARRLRQHELEGATFTVSNLGMMGIHSFTAVLNPPAACILAVGALAREPVVRESGSVGVGWRMRVTLGCDHRAVDGATGARFLAALRRRVTTPELLAG